MNFDFSEDQELVRSQIRRILKSNSPSLAMRRLLECESAPGEALWSELCDFGVPSTGVPEHLAGNGLGCLDLCVIAEELGATLAPVPVLGSRFLVIETLLGAAPENIQQELIPDLASGKRCGALVDCSEPGVSHATISNSLASGRLLCAIDGMPPDIVVMINCQGHHFIMNLNQPAVRTATRRKANAAWPELDVRFAEAQVIRLPQDEETDRRIGVARNRAAVFAAFLQLGGAQRCLEDAVAYARERMAFGRPIGSFQALKHLLADTYVKIELARSNCYYGASALIGGNDSLSRASALAHLSASEAYIEAAKACTQVHGAMGFTWDLDCHLHVRRALHLSTALGGRHSWKRRLAQDLRTEMASRLSATPRIKEAVDGL